MKNGMRMNFIVKLAILAVMCFCAVSILRMRSEYNDLVKTEQELLKKKSEYEDSIDRLRSELEHEMDEDYIRRVAREKLNYYLPDEIVFYSDRGGR